MHVELTQEEIAAKRRQIAAKRVALMREMFAVLCDVQSEVTAESARKIDDIKRKVGVE